MKRKPTSTAAMAVAATLIVLAQILPAQDFTVQMKDEDGRSIATHYISRNAVRNVSSEPVDSDMIYRLDTGKIITLNHKQKTYGEIAAAEMRQLIEKKQVSMSAEKQEAMRRLGFGGGATITKIGAGEHLSAELSSKLKLRRSASPE